MSKKVAIVSVAQSAGAESKDNFYDQAYRVTRECLDKVGLSRDDLEYLRHLEASDTGAGQSHQEEQQ